MELIASALGTERVQTLAILSPGFFFFMQHLYFLLENSVLDVSHSRFYFFF